MNVAVGSKREENVGIAFLEAEQEYFVREFVVASSACAKAIEVPPLTHCNQCGAARKDWRVGDGDSD